MGQENHSPGRALFWAGLLGVLSGLAISGVALWLLTAPPQATLTLLPPPSPEPWLIQVDGAVQRPGLYRLPPGARVNDALQAAGGPRPEADLQQVNLAARLQDGARVWIPRRAETPPPTPSPPAAGWPTSPATGKLDLNTATAAQLEALPGIGPALAQRILDYREQHGPFRQVDDLLAVPGIGPTKLEQIRPYVTVLP